MSKTCSIKYWFGGMPVPSTLPKGCEYYNDYLGKWDEEPENPEDWTCLAYPRRWPVFTDESNHDKPAKGHFVIGDNMKTDGEFKLVYCTSCGQEIRILVPEKETK